jgi:hypothetical protein
MIQGQAKIVGGHQPVAEFHSGLIAKVFALNQWIGKRVWIVHDLDSLEEEGAISIKIPTKQGHVKHVPIFKVEDRSKLFTFEGTFLGIGKVVENIISWLEPSKWKIKKIREKKERFEKIFKPGTQCKIGKFNTEIHQFLIEEIFERKISFPRDTICLSDFLQTTEGMELMKETIETFSPPKDFFWLWEDNTRKKILEELKLKENVSNLKLIPKALALSFIFRKLAGENGVLIRGLGQKKYESETPYKDLLPKVRIEMTVSSVQTLPNINLRPSLLLMYLLDIQFDPSKIIFEKD